jgi:hypothetical protein
MGKELNSTVDKICAEHFNGGSVGGWVDGQVGK